MEFETEHVHPVCVCVRERVKHVHPLTVWPIIDTILLIPTLSCWLVRLRNWISSACFFLVDLTLFCGRSLRLLELQLQFIQLSLQISCPTPSPAPVQVSVKISGFI